jgi:hypothetical protein
MAAKRALLVNPNRYHHPPVIPIGLEHLASALEERGHGVSLLDLCFSAGPLEDMKEKVLDYRPDAICVTVRNIDTVLYPDTEYFLPLIGDLISAAREDSEAPIIIGGAGMKADPEGILERLGADLALVGPAESTLPDIISALPSLPDERIIRCEAGFSSPLRGKYVEYSPYFDKGGIAGFETHKGCSSSCPYCIEARTPVALRDKGEVISDLRALYDAGADHLHLCDSEFNEDNEYCIDLLKEMKKKAPTFKWTLYMQTARTPKEMFPLLARTGAYHITLSADTLDRGTAYIDNACDIVRHAADSGISTSIDLLGGFPGEKTSAIVEATGRLLDAGAKEVVVNTVLRLYKGLPLARQILSSPEYSSLVTGDPGMLSPCFYFHITPEEAREILGTDPRIRIAGEQRGVNYERA